MEEALKWEQKALELDLTRHKGDAAYKSEFSVAIERMKKGEKIWIEQK
ncbi:hypothetical protein [Pedobacter sp. Leaf216]|nr:hypothetical protein [Pedobacter sp. Leaf216]